MGALVLSGTLNAFHVLGSLLALWALTVTAIGVRSESFPRTGGQTVLVGAISVVLTVGAIASAIIVGALEADEDESAAAGKPAEQAAPVPAGALRLAADPTGQLKFDKSKLEAQAGKVSIAMTNRSTVIHDVSLEGRGVDEHGKLVKGGGTSTVSAQLKPGRYTFYCSVTGHRAAGMEGTLTVK
jgi:plastocyanin